MDTQTIVTLVFGAFLLIINMVVHGLFFNRRIRECRKSGEKCFDLTLISFAGLSVVISTTAIIAGTSFLSGAITYEQFQNIRTVVIVLFLIMIAIYVVGSLNEHQRILVVHDERLVNPPMGTARLLNEQDYDTHASKDETPNEPGVTDTKK